MHIVHVAQRRLGISAELVSFMLQNKRWWAVPIVLVLLTVSVLVIFALSSSIAPFIYTLF